MSLSLSSLLLAHTHVTTWGQSYKTFYHGNVLPFHGNAIILCYKAILPWQLLWNGSKLTWYCFITLAPDETIPNTVVIYHNILTLEKAGALVNYYEYS